MSHGKVTPRDTTMTFTCFVFFDMFNALSCRSQVYIFCIMCHLTIKDIGFYESNASTLTFIFRLNQSQVLVYSPIGCFFTQLLVQC